MVTQITTAACVSTNTYDHCDPTSLIQELDAEQQKHVTDAMAEEKQRVLTLDELVDAVGRIQKVPDKDRIAKIVELLDEDRDGTINQVSTVEHLREEGKVAIQYTSILGSVRERNFFQTN